MTQLCMHARMEIAHLMKGLMREGVYEALTRLIPNGYQLQVVAVLWVVAAVRVRCRDRHSRLTPEEGAMRGCATSGLRLHRGGRGHEAESTAVRGCSIDKVEDDDEADDAGGRA